MSSLVKLSRSWSKLFKLCIPPHVRIHTDHKSLTKSRQRRESQVRQAGAALSGLLTTGAHVRKSCCPHRWASAARGRKNSPGGWPWWRPPSCYGSVCPGCCRTAAGWSLCPVRPFWARTGPGYGDHPWPPCLTMLALAPRAQLCWKPKGGHRADDGGGDGGGGGAVAARTLELGQGWRHPAAVRVAQYQTLLGTGLRGLSQGFLQVHLNGWKKKERERRKQHS